MTVADNGWFEFKSSDWFVSDLHFGHSNVIKYCDRPYCCKHAMNEDLIHKWNEKVKPNARIFVLGDFAFGNKGFKKRIIERLNGYKILVKGNHDPGRNTMVEIGFDEAYLTISGTWNINDDMKTIFASHIPMKEACSAVDHGLCGHVHEKWTKSGNIVNVGVDVWDYEPQKLKFIIDNADSRQAAMTEQNTLDQSWSSRDDILVKEMYQRSSEVRDESE